MLVNMARWVQGLLMVVCCLHGTFSAQGRRHLDKLDKSRRHSTGFIAKSLNNSECADLRYGMAYLDNLLAPRVRLAHPPALTQFRFMHLATEVQAIQADGSYRRNAKRGRFNGLRPDPKMLYGDRLTPRNEINHLLTQIHEILQEAKVNMHRVKSRLHRLMSRSPQHLREEVYDLMRSVYDTRTHARDLLDNIALLPYSLYNARLLCHQQHGNYSCPLPAIRRTKHLQVLSWTWHHARADNEYEAARKLFRKVVDMASSNRDQLFKLVTIKHEYFRHNTRRRLREHHRRIRRATRRLKRVANLNSRLRDRLRIIQRSYKQVNQVLQEYSSLKSTVRKSHSGVNAAHYALTSIHGPIYSQLIESLPVLFDMRYNYMEKRKRYRLEMLYRMNVHINSLRDETDWIIEPIDRPMRRASPYTELIEKHFNISTVVKVMGEQIAQTQQNLVEFTDRTNKFILSKIKDMEDKNTTEGSGDVDKEEGRSDHTSPLPTVNQTTMDTPVNVTDVVTTEITTPTTTEKECDWWDWACKAAKKSTTPPSTPLIKSTLPSSTANIQTIKGSPQTTMSTTVAGMTLVYSTMETTAQQQITSTPMTTTTQATTTPTEEPRKSATETLKSTETTTETSTIPTSTTVLTTTTESNTGGAKVTPTKLPKTTTTCDWWFGCADEETDEDGDKEDSESSTTTKSANTEPFSTATQPTTMAATTTTTTTTTTPTTTTEPTTAIPETTTNTPETTESETTTIPTTTTVMTTAAETTQPLDTTTTSTTTTEFPTESEAVKNKVTPTKLPKKTTTCDWWWGCADEESEMLMDDSSFGSEEISPKMKSDEKMVGDAPWWSIFTSDDKEKDEEEKEESKSTATVEEKSRKKSLKMMSKEKMLGDGWGWWGSSTDDDDEEEETDEDENEESKSTTTEVVITTTTTTKTTVPTPTSTIQATTTTKTTMAATTSTTTDGSSTVLQQSTTRSSQKPSTLPQTTTTKPNITPPEASIVQAFTPSAVDNDNLIFEGEDKSSIPVPVPKAVVIKEADDPLMLLEIEDCEDSGSGDGDPVSCHPQINESTNAARYLRKKLHKVQGESYNSLFTAKDMRFLVNETKHRLRIRRRDLYSEIQNFPQDEAAAFHQLVPDVSHLVLPPARTENLDFKMNFVNKKTETLQERLSSYVHKLNETRTRIAEVDRTRQQAVPPSIEVAKAREQFGKLVQVDYDIALRARRIKHMAETIDWQLATMKRRIQQAENIHKSFIPVVPLNDQTAMSGRVPASLRRPAAVKTVSVMVKTNSATGSLLQFTSLSSRDSDTSIDVSIANGMPCAEWAGKRTKKKVICERAINDGKWHQLHITRSGNELVLQENSMEEPDDIVSNRVSLPVAAMFDPLPRRVQLQPVRHGRHRGKRDVTTFKACLTNLHVDGSYVVMETNTTQGNLSLQTCDALIMNSTRQLPVLSVLSVNQDEAHKKCLSHNKTVIDLTSNYGTLFMISVSFITKERKGAILVYRTSAEDLWVLRLFQGHVMFEGMVNGERFRKLCYSSTPLTSRRWHLFAVNMDNLASSIILDGEMCLSTRMRLLPQPDSGHINLTVYATHRDLREVAQQRLPSRSHITRFHGKLRDLMINNRKVSIIQERNCTRKND